jgi:putative flippase GtrA
MSMAGRAEAPAVFWPEIGLQGGRFIVVGVVATLTHVLVAVCLISALGVRPAALANAIAVVAGSSVSYLGNYFWTFRRGGRHLVRLPRFAVAYMTVFVLNALVMGLVADLGGVAYLIPLVAVIAMTPVATFLLNRYWVFA